MVKATEVIGRKVMGREGGEDIGKVKDLVVDPTGKQVIGFVVSEGLIHGAKVAPWSALQAIGPDAVILNSADSVVKASEAPDIKVVLDRDLNIRGLRLQSTEGKELGQDRGLPVRRAHRGGGRLRAFGRSLLAELVPSHAATRSSWAKTSPSSVRKRRRPSRSRRRGRPAEAGPLWCRYEATAERALCSLSEASWAIGSSAGLPVKLMAASAFMADTVDPPPSRS